LLRFFDRAVKRCHPEVEEFMMTVLVAVASRHGATQEIAERIGKAIHHAGFAVDVVKLVDSSEYGPRPDPAEYDAVVIGSAVYLGRWLAPAREFIRENAETLKSMPVWAFSSGPVGEQRADGDEGPTGAALLGPIDPVDHRVFGGKIDRAQLGPVEHAVVAVIRAPDEDDRDWDAISAWAGEISRALPTAPATPLV
jgi:menaquinone-dependent protoporphyrinogen oxidase